MWFALGLEEDFKTEVRNGETYTSNFINVAICDNEDIDKASFVLWDRVWKSTEEKDRNRIKAILKAEQFLSN